MSERDSAFDALKTLISLTDKDADPEAGANTLLNAQMSSSLAFELSAEDIGAQTKLSAAACGAVDFVDELTRYILLEQMGKNPKLDRLEKMGSYFTALFKGRHVEYCYLACLDESKRLTRCCRMGKGTINAAGVYVRSIAQTAQISQAKYAILAHNHPGGTLVPSSSDIELTLMARDALALTGIKLLEHIIVTRSSYAGIIGGGYL